MRYIFIAFFIFSISKISGQDIDWGGFQFKGPIIRLIEKSKGSRQYWREYYFDSLSRIQEINYYRDKKLVGIDEWDYLDRDTLFIAKEKVKNLSYSGTNREIIVISKDSIEFDTYIHKYFYNTDRRLIRYEWFDSRDSINPKIVTFNFVYKDNHLQQYKRVIINSGDTTLIELYKFDYNQNFSAITIKRTDNKNITNEISIYKYDKENHLISVLHDFNDPMVVLGGVRCWSNSRNDKYQMAYKYDKYGNWIKSYYITRYWKYRYDTRIIEYK